MKRPRHQVMYALHRGRLLALTLPPPEAEVLAGVPWGCFDVLLTPAFWAGRDWLHRLDPLYSATRLGSTLREEVVACLLGGYGIPAEVGLAAFRRLRDAGIIERSPPVGCIARLLEQPLTVGGRQVRYRFALQRAGYIAECLQRLPSEPDLPVDDRSLRTLLLELPGIGPKTASWITRNLRDSDDVAILDVHVCRACTAAQVFGADANPARDYFKLEDRFLEFARAVSARASHLDNVIWQTMRRIGGHVRSLLSPRIPAIDMESAM